MYLKDTEKETLEVILPVKVVLVDDLQFGGDQQGNKKRICA